MSCHPIPTFYLDNITDANQFCGNYIFLRFPNNSRVLWHHVLKRFHDCRRFGFLVVRETSGDDDNPGKHDTKIELRRQSLTDKRVSVLHRSHDSHYRVPTPLLSLLELNKRESITRRQSKAKERIHQIVACKICSNKVA